MRDWDVVTLKFECLYDLYIMEWERFKFEIVSLKVECLYGSYIIKSWVYNILTLLKIEIYIFFTNIFKVF